MAANKLFSSLYANFPHQPHLKAKILFNFYTLTRLVRTISVKTREQFIRRHLRIRSMLAFKGGLRPAFKPNLFRLNFELKNEAKGLN